MRSYTGYLCIFLAAACWGLIGPIARFAFESNITPLEVAFWRCAFGGIFFFIHAAATQALKVQKVDDLIVFALFGAISVGGFFASYQYAVKIGGAALASVLLYTAPAWVAIFSRFILGESLDKVKIIAVAMSLAGVFCISISGTGNSGETIAIRLQEGITARLNITGLIFGLLAGLLYSTHYIFTARFLKRYTAFTLYCYLMIFGSLVLLPFIEFMPKSLSDWCVLGFLGGICTYGAYCFYCEGLKRLAPTRAAVLATFEPVIAIFAAWWIWGESFAALGWAGAVLVIGAVVCLVLVPGRDKQLRLET